MIEHVFLEKISEFNYFMNNNFLNLLKLKFDEVGFSKEVSDYVEDYNEKIDEDDDIDDDDKEDEYIDFYSVIQEIIPNSYYDDLSAEGWISVDTTDLFSLKNEFNKLKSFFESIDKDRRVFYANEFYKLEDHIEFIIKTKSDVIDFNEFNEVYQLKYKIEYENDDFVFHYEIDNSTNIQLINELSNFVSLKIVQEKEKLRS